MRSFQLANPPTLVRLNCKIRQPLVRLNCKMRQPLVRLNCQIRQPCLKLSCQIRQPFVTGKSRVLSLPGAMQIIVTCNPQYQPYHRLLLGQRGQYPTKARNAKPRINSAPDALRFASCRGRKALALSAYDRRFDFACSCFLRLFRTAGSL